MVALCDALLRRGHAYVAEDHLLFDVPVIGASTIPVMLETGTTALAIDAGSTLLLDREELLEAANREKISIVGLKPGAENSEVTY